MLATRLLLLVPTPPSSSRLASPLLIPSASLLSCSQLSLLSLLPLLLALTLAHLLVFARETTSSQPPCILEIALFIGGAVSPIPSSDGTLGGFGSVRKGNDDAENSGVDGKKFEKNSWDDAVEVDGDNSDGGGGDRCFVGSSDSESDSTESCNCESADDRSRLRDCAAINDSSLDTVVSLATDLFIIVSAAFSDGNDGGDGAAVVSAFFVNSFPHAISDGVFPTIAVFFVAIVVVVVVVVVVAVFAVARFPVRDWVQS